VSALLRACPEGQAFRFQGPRVQESCGGGSSTPVGRTPVAWPFRFQFFTALQAMNAAVEVGRDESLLLSFAAGEGSPNLSRSGMRAPVTL